MLEQPGQWQQEGRGQQRVHGGGIALNAALFGGQTRPLAARLDGRGRRGFGLARLDLLHDFTHFAIGGRAGEERPGHRSHPPG